MIRRFSLDELPNLVNVLRGEMAIVGPRATLPAQAELYTDRQRRRLELRPGVTVQLVPGAVVDLGDGVSIEVIDA